MTLATVIAAMILPGCAAPPGPVFGEPSLALAWPPPPQPPRLCYVGELRTSADLKARPSGFEQLGALLVGRKPPNPLFGPRTLTCAPDGQRAWIADPGGRCLHLFDLQRRSYRRVTTAGDSPLLSPVGVCLGPDDSIFACDSEAVAIHQFSARDGRWLRTLRLPEEILRPVALGYDETADELFVVDVNAHDVKVLRGDGALLRIIGRRGVGAGDFNYPSALSLTKDRLWIADTGNHRVQAVTRLGEPLATIGQVGDAPGDLAFPKGVAVDPDGQVYVVDARFENVQVFDAQGNLLLYFGEEGTGPGEFWLPGGIFIEPSGRVWVCDAYNHRVQVFQYVGESQHAP